MKTLGLALLVVFGLYAAVVVLVFLLQRSLMFAPSLERVLPSTVNGAVAMGIQEVTLRTPAAEQLLLVGCGSARAADHFVPTWQRGGGQHSP